MLIRSSQTQIPADLIRPDLVGFNPAALNPQANYIPNPIVIEQTARGERQYDIYSRLLLDRIVFLGTEGRRGTLITHGFHAPKELEMLHSQAPTEEAAASAPTLSSNWASAEHVAKLEGELNDLRAQMQQVQEALAAAKQQLQALKDALGA